MRRGFYAGSFDPVTKGHLNIIQRASQVVDELIVAIMTNPKKRRFMSAEVMQEKMQTLVPSNVKVICCLDELTIVASQRYKASLLIRSLRNSEDLIYEQSLAQVNRELGEIETIYFIAAPQYQHVSSSLVRELYHYHGDYKRYVPNIIFLEMEKQRKENEKEKL